MPHRASAARILVHGQHPPQHSASDGVTLALDGLHDLRDIFLAGVVVGSLHHHADKGLGAGLTNQNTSGIAQRFSHSLDGLLHCRVVLCGLFIGDADILQNLRIDLQRLSQLAHGQFFGQHDLHHLQAGQDTITGAGVLAEDNMTALLTANTAAVFAMYS